MHVPVTKVRVWSEYDLRALEEFEEWLASDSLDWDAIESEDAWTD